MGGDLLLAAAQKANPAPGNHRIETPRFEKPTCHAANVRRPVATQKATGTAGTTPPLVSEFPPLSLPSPSFLPPRRARDVQCPCSRSPTVRYFAGTGWHRRPVSFVAASRQPVPGTR